MKSNNIKKEKDLVSKCPSILKKTIVLEKSKSKESVDWTNVYYFFVKFFLLFFVMFLVRFVVISFFLQSFKTVITLDTNFHFWSLCRMITWHINTAKCKTVAVNNVQICIILRYLLNLDSESFQTQIKISR